MIVDFEQALAFFNKIDNHKKSFYYHPLFVEASSQESNDLEPIYFVKEEQGQIFYHAALIGDIGFENYKDLQTPYGYGGPLILGDEVFKARVIDEYNSLCNEYRILVEFVRFHPLIKNEKYYYGDILNNRNTVSINLNIENIFKSFSTRVKTALRATEKNSIQVIASKDEYYIDKFYEIYTSLMNQKQASEEYFFSKKYIKSLLEHKDVYLFNALTEKGEILGGAIFMICDELADYHLSATTSAGRTLNISHLLLYKFSEFAKTQNVQKLYLGGGTNNDPANSLLFFKQGFSKDIHPFLIGYKIFNTLKYEEFNRIYLNNTDNRKDRILFYR
ncbi:hypothetical protein AEA09_18250 [Lysinibacillus contaminans]|uniref:N-acetyltransferase domain-containing protein n=1 Tax=Lysinibacillus contaminans TaxID=1293441 RepID=A0ABR5JWZ0_9BACI|nr:GNAT family N-acetyltransferase [Lysinibacillus contaminans]KOS66676.1 hypothetical protein AEA09_18250 [Lysinibacillus contaminans]